MIVASPTLVPALAPVEAALATVRRRRGVTGSRGLAPGLLVPVDASAAETRTGDGWFPAGRLVDGGPELDRMLAVARGFWSTSPHVAAALAWRSYTYWLVMPVVLGWATARRVPLLSAADTLVQLDGAGQLLRIGLRRVRLAVLPDDPLATSGPADRTPAGMAEPAVVVADGESELLAVLRRSLRDEHLDPLLGQFQRRARLGRRTLCGSVASAVGYAAVRGMDASPAEIEASAAAVLSALDLSDLVTLTPGPDGPEVRRHTCCLAFKLPEPKICSGCCLRAET